MKVERLVTHLENEHQVQDLKRPKQGSMGYWFGVTNSIMNSARRMAKSAWHPPLTRRSSMDLWRLMLAL